MTAELEALLKRNYETDLSTSSSRACSRRPARPVPAPSGTSATISTINPRAEKRIAYRRMVPMGRFLCAHQSRPRQDQDRCRNDRLGAGRSHPVMRRKALRFSALRASDRRSVATARPLFGRVHHSRPNRIQDDVARQLRYIRVLVDQYAL